MSLAYQAIMAIIAALLAAVAPAAPMTNPRLPAPPTVYVRVTPTVYVNALGSGTVVGTLIDDDTGGLVQGLTVSACSPMGCLSAPQPSDATGQYRLPLPTSNGWNVFTGDCTRYAMSHKFSVNAVDGGTTRVDLHLTKHMASISGRVVDQKGAPIANVSVMVDNTETGGFGLAFASSGSDGAYSAGCLAASGVAGTGSYYITSGPPPDSPYAASQDSGIAVSPGATAHHDIVLPVAGGSISGQVSCGGGACPPGASVLVYCEGCTSSSYTTVGPDGHYVARNLEAGRKYDVHLVAPAGWDNAIHYAVTAATADFNLVASGPATSGRLNGRVVRSSGEARGQCVINAFGNAGGATGGWSDGDIRTDADGNFDSGSVLVPGDYQLFLACPGTPPVTLWGGRPISVAAGKATDASYRLGAGGN
jgi:hypothetical protein